MSKSKSSIVAPRVPTQGAHKRSERRSGSLPSPVHCPKQVSAITVQGRQRQQAVARGRAWAMGGGAIHGGRSYRDEGWGQMQRQQRRQPKPHFSLTEIGGLNGVVEVLGRPRGHAVWTPDPRG